MGQTVVVADYNGSSWDTPVEIPDSLGLNGEVRATTDSNGNRLLVWSHADTSSITPETTTDALLAMRDSADPVYSVFTGGSWSSPQPVATTSGADEWPTLATTSDGETMLVSTRKSLDDGTWYLETYTWDGVAWSASTTIATSSQLLHEPAASTLDGKPVVFWSQEKNDDESELNPDLMYSVFDAGNWSSPTVFTPSLAAGIGAEATELDDLGHGNVLAEGTANFPPVPEDCDKEEEEDPEDPNQQDDGDGGNTRRLRSFDPNDKIGPDGFGDKNYVVDGSLMPFTIYYENDPEEGATAAAQVVKVEDQLDASLDWLTFELGDINLFGDFVACR